MQELHAAITVMVDHFGSLSCHSATLCATQLYDDETLTATVHHSVVSNYKRGTKKNHCIFHKILFDADIYIYRQENPERVKAPLPP